MSIIQKFSFNKQQILYIQFNKINQSEKAVLIANLHFKALFNKFLLVSQLINNKIIINLNQNFAMADDIKRILGGKKGSGASEKSPKASPDDLQDSLECQPIYKTAISLSSSHSDSDSVIEPSELFSTTDQELCEPKQSISLDQGHHDEVAPENSTGFVVVDDGRQVEMEEFRARVAAARESEEEELDRGEGEVVAAGEEAISGSHGWQWRGEYDKRGDVDEYRGEWRNQREWFGQEDGQKIEGREELAENGRTQQSSYRVNANYSESRHVIDNKRKTSFSKHPLNASVSETQTTDASFSSPCTSSLNPYEQNQDEENGYAPSTDDITAGQRHPSEQYTTSLSDQNSRVGNGPQQEAVHKSVQQADEKKEKCFFCFDLAKGISLLVRIQILTMMLFWYSFFFKIVTNPFMNDPKMQIFLAVQAITNSLRFYAAFLAWQWYQNDNAATRRKLQRSFLIWFLVDILAFVNKTYINQKIFGMSWAAYKFHKQYHVPLPTPPPPPLPSSLPQNTTLAPEPPITSVPQSPTPLEPTPSTYQQDLHSHLSFIHSFEKQKVLLRVFLWLPLKFYFFCVARRYAAHLVELDSGSRAKRQVQVEGSKHVRMGGDVELQEN